jgi:hypothetical protein
MFHGIPPVCLIKTKLTLPEYKPNTVVPASRVHSIHAGINRKRFKSVELTRAGSRHCRNSARPMHSVLGALLFSTTVPHTESVAIASPAAAVLSGFNDIRGNDGSGYN